MTLKFSGNFWGEGGFPVVQTFMKAGLKNVTALQELLEERAAVEEHYVKSLLKLTKRFADITEQGSLQVSLVKIKDEIEQEGNLRTQFAQELKTHATTLGSVYKEVKKHMKSPSNEAEKANKEYHSLNGNITKAKAKYEKACQENAANDAKVRTEVDPKIKAKLESTQQKLQKSQTSAEQEYQASIQKLTAYQPTYEEKMRGAYDALQNCEIQRADAMKTGLDGYCRAMRVTESLIPKAVESISGILNGVNARTDLDGWIAANKTFTSPPPPPKFEAFGTISGPGARASASLTSSQVNGAPSSGKHTSGGYTAAPVEKKKDKEKDKKHKEEHSSPRHEEVHHHHEHHHEEEPPQEAAPSAPTEEALYDDGSGYQEEYAEGEGEYAPGSGYGEVVTAAWDYDAKEDNELGFKAGEQITIISKDDEGWWVGTNADGHSGMFPANYVTAAE